MSDIPNIKVKIKDGDAFSAEVTNADTGEPIRNIAGLRIDLDANRQPFAIVELSVYIDLEYEGPAELLPAQVFPHETEV